MVYTYMWYEWLFFFFLYCFFGWIFESTYVSLKHKKFVNRGFLHIPMLPLYGSGAMIILFIAIPIESNIFLVFFLGAIAATILEYFTGVAMERLFKVRYWDYSHQKFNFQGQICLSSTIAWGFLSVLLSEVIHKPIEALVTKMMNHTVVMVLACVISVVFIIDTYLSFKAAWDLRKVLEKMTFLKEEAAAIQKRLVELSHEAFDYLDEIKDDSFGWLSGIKEDGKVKMAALKDSGTEYFNDLSEDIRRQMTERLEKLKNSYESMKVNSSVMKNSVLRRNPTASSKKYAEAFKEYKNRWSKKRRDSNEQKSK